ncbi:endonuclease/exonuclease/phosphatase family protein [Micromonospora sp. NPDC049679]|uniref:endonuclease/exonuclease/phosphatase family protein n=1 Tax=Micromonospora sp. NPDC049679 TaxID=3155920 RepID=UPI0033E2DF21
MTYNIKTGGQDRGDRRRLDQVLAVIDEQRPDVLALQELRGFGGFPGFRRDRLVDRCAMALGMTAFLAGSLIGQPVAVLIRRPGRRVSAAPIRRPFHHAAARVVVDTDRGPLAVVGTHLDPFSGRRRLREARWLAARLRHDPMALLMGDLNSLDPWSEHDERIERLAARHRSRHLMAGSSATVDTRAVATLEAAGLVDLFRQAPSGSKDYTAPTEQGGGREFSGMRLDYIMATARVAALARGCRVVDGGAAEWASDHHPVVADLDLSLAT